MTYEFALDKVAVPILVACLVSIHRQWVRTCISVILPGASPAKYSLMVLQVTCYIMVHTDHTIQIINTYTLGGLGAWEHQGRPPPWYANKRDSRLTPPPKCHMKQLLIQSHEQHDNSPTVTTTPLLFRSWQLWGSSLNSNDPLLARPLSKIGLSAGPGHQLVQMAAERCRNRGTAGTFVSVGLPSRCYWSVLTVRRLWFHRHTMKCSAVRFTTV